MFENVRDVLLDYYLNFYKNSVLTELIEHKSPFYVIDTRAIDEYIKVNDISGNCETANDIITEFTKIYSADCHISPDVTIKSSWRSNEMDNLYQNLIYLLNFCLGAIDIIKVIETTNNVDFSSLKTKNPPEITIDSQTALHLINTCAVLRLSNSFMFDTEKNLSTVEVAMLNQYARFYDAQQFSNNWNDKKIVMVKFCDECDVYKHTNLQRRYIYDLMRMLNTLYPKRYVVVFLTTHSPFVLSDILSANNRFINKNHNIVNYVDLDSIVAVNTFGWDVHLLFKKWFFYGKHNRRICQSED